MTAAARVICVTTSLESESVVEACGDSSRGKVNSEYIDQRQDAGRFRQLPQVGVQGPASSVAHPPELERRSARTPLPVA